MKTQKQVIGKYGEDLACEYLKQKNFFIKQRNYLKKYGEIDIIAENRELSLFVEVKTVTRDPSQTFSSSKRYICNTFNHKQRFDEYKPENNIHLYKRQRLKRTIQAYIASLGQNMDYFVWRFDIILIKLAKDDMSLISLEHLEDIIL